jgi:hypothetical protein
MIYTNKDIIRRFGDNYSHFVPLKLTLLNPGRENTSNEKIKL